METRMNLKGIVLVATALVANIGIINAEQISIPSVSIPLGAKTTQLDRVQPQEVMPYLESKVTGETELSYAVMSVAKKTFNEQMLLHRRLLILEKAVSILLMTRNIIII